MKLMKQVRHDPKIMPYLPIIIKLSYEPPAF